MSQACQLRKYGVQATIDFEVYEVDGVDLRTDWTPAQADCEIMKDGGSSTMCTNTATDEGSTYSIVLTATEMQAARLVLKVVDSATKVFLDRIVVIETYGNASAQHAMDLDDAVRGGLTSLPNAAAAADGGLVMKLDRNADLTESQRGAHTWQGNIYYVAPANGNDSTGDGTRALPYATIQAAHDDLVTDSNHDVIMLVADAAAGATTHTGTGTTTISKRYCFIRGPGRDMICVPSTNVDTFTITADGVELSGFQINTTGVGSGDGVQITDADFIRVQHCWINATRGDGINILRGDNCQIRNNVFTDTGQSGTGQGIDILGTAGSSNNNVIKDNIFRDCAGDAIQISGGTTNNTTICSNLIEGATAYGINIGNSSTDAFVCGNELGNNTSGNINDSGTTSVILNNVEWAKHSIATEARLAELDAANLPSDIDAVKTKTDFLPSATAGATGGVFIAGTNAATTITTSFTTTFTGNLTGSVGSVTGAVGSVTGAVGSVTGNVGGNVTGSVGSLAAQAKADVNAEVLDVLVTDTFAEGGQGAPGATISLKDKIGFVYTFMRNKSTQTATEKKIFADDGSTVNHKATISDDATTFTSGELGTGA